MTKEELNRVLELQNKAYNLLLWIDEQARHQVDLLSDENVAAWKYADSCQSWIRRMIGIFPRDLRVEENDISDFARLFSAFFTTSFHVEEKNESTWHYDPHSYKVTHRKKLVAGAPALLNKTPTEKKRLRQKAEESARNLQQIALEELAIENDFDISSTRLAALSARDDLKDALNLYSYAHELLRRSQFASQGAAVHSLWSSMDMKTRQKINTETIWQARERLLEVMRNAAK